MNCSEIEAALNDYVDGELDDGGRRTLESHLADCPRCSKDLRMLQELLERSARLPREAPPSVDLWPDVRAGLKLRGPRSSLPRKVSVAERFSRSGWRLAAAGIFLVVSTAAITYVVVRPSGVGGAVTSSTGAMEAPAGGVRVLSEFREAEAAFTDAADHLGSLLNTRREEISPETIAVVERNLQIINRAITDARRALEKDPGNMRLGHLLTAMHHRKVDLLRRATRLSDPV